MASLLSALVSLGAVGWELGVSAIEHTRCVRGRGLEMQDGCVVLRGLVIPLTGCLVARSLRPAGTNPSWDQ